MRVELLGAIAIVALTIGIAIAAVAARTAWWPLWVLAGAIVTCGTIAALFTIRHVSAMMRGRPTEPELDADQRRPEGAASAPGLGCGESRRVDTDGRATRTALDSQP